MLNMVPTTIKKVRQKGSEVEERRGRGREGGKEERGGRRRPGRQVMKPTLIRHVKGSRIDQVSTWKTVAVLPKINGKYKIRKCQTIKK